MTRDSLAAHQLADSPTDELRPLSYARRRWIPRRHNGKPVSPSTIFRWARKGVRGVKLPVLFTPTGAVTSEKACRHFLEEVDRVRRGSMNETRLIDASDDDLRRAGLIGGAK